MRLLLYGVGTVAVLMLGSLLVSAKTDPPVRRLDAVPPPVLSTTQFELAPIALLDTCTIRTDHRDWLIASFELSNILEQPVLLTGLQGHPVRGGLRQTGPARSGGSCARPGKAAARAVIEPMGSRLYTVRWKLPDTCPEPFPLQVRITYQLTGEDLLKSDYITVLKDLGGLGFRQCPQVVATDFG